MKPYKQLVEENLINENKIVSRAFIAKFYKEQLIKFNKLGMGKKTENGVKITPELIAITVVRLNQLQPSIRLKEEHGRRNGSIK